MTKDVCEVPVLSSEEIGMGVRVANIFGEIESETEPMQGEKDMILIVVVGRVRVTSGGKTAELSQGSTCYIPAGEEHTFFGTTQYVLTAVYSAPASR